MAVDFIFREFATAESGEGREEVDGGRDLGASFSGRNVTGPPHNGWLTNTTIVDTPFF